ncbi:hypothetical protein GCM10009609_55170 [Pseudonocardia aurantiaca]
MRTGVAAFVLELLELSAPTEQGTNSSALQIADALFAALVALGPATYLAGTAVAAALALAAVSTAGRARMSPASLSSSPSVPNR